MLFFVKQQKKFQKLMKKMYPNEFVDGCVLSSKTTNNNLFKNGIINIMG